MSGVDVQGVRTYADEDRTPDDERQTPRVSRATSDRLVGDTERTPARAAIDDLADALFQSDDCSADLAETVAMLREQLAAKDRAIVNARTVIGDLERQLVAESANWRDVHAELGAVRAERLALQTSIREYMHGELADAVLHKADAVAECQREAARRGCVARVARRSNGGA